METRNDSTLDVLNTLLKDELSAVQTYEVALRDRSAFSAKTELSRCQRSHEARVVLLSDKIVSLGGEPASKSGIVGTWSTLVERGAAAISDDMAIRALELGEDHVLHDYRARLSSVRPEIRMFLERHLLPLEELTYRTLSDLKDRIASA